jgi:hypothetical protein
MIDSSKARVWHLGYNRHPLPVYLLYMGIEKDDIFMSIVDENKSILCYTCDFALCVSRSARGTIASIAPSAVAQGRCVHFRLSVFRTSYVNI